MQVLVVAAHPDDEVLGCGATLAQLSKENDICCLILGEGGTSRGGCPDVRLDAVKALKRQSLCAADAIGISDVRHLGLPDNRFDTIALLDIVQSIEATIREVSPEVVFTHHGEDLNIDHAIAFQAVLTATRPMEGSSIRSVYTFETPSSTEWAFESRPFCPNVFVSVENYMQAKLDAMRCYKNELGEFPHPRSLQALEARASYWGSVAGVSAAEAFRCVRKIVQHKKGRGLCL